MPEIVRYEKHSNIQPSLGNDGIFVRLSSRLHDYLVKGRRF